MADGRILFFDIDGTLVDSRTRRISEKTKEALHRLHQRGNRLFIATGRPPASLPDLTGLPFDGFITANGSLCYTADEILFHKPISPEAVEQVIRNAAGLGRPVSVATRDRLAANGWDEDLAEYYRLAGVELTVTENFAAVCQENIYQIMLGCREADHPAIARGVEGVSVTFSWSRAADVICAGNSKANAIERVLRHYQLDISRSMAFGDGCNDIEMLQTVGIGIAMGNADSRVKAIAEGCCPPVWEDGIYHYCTDQGLI